MSEQERDPVAYLSSPAVVRERCGQLYALAKTDALDHFALDLSKLDAAVKRVVEVTKRNYPSLEIPYHARWRHFSVGGVDRAKRLEDQIRDRDELGRARIELAITSVLLDAGAGDAWHYVEQEAQTNVTFARSEGLAVASLHMFCSGTLSSDASVPLRADAARLRSIDPDTLALAFQVSADNPLVGLDGRAELLRRLGDVVTRAPWSNVGGVARLGGLFDLLRAHAQARDGVLDGPTLLAIVVGAMGEIWPGRIVLAGRNAGDVWPHSKVHGEGLTDKLVPFHKLSQWLTYSLVEPLEQAGIPVHNLDGLTGLPEYRNGGLFLDSGVLVPKHRDLLEASWKPGDEPIVEWRALTVSLLDEIAPRVRAALGKTAADFPLAKVLEGGTWAAGRELAREKRKGGGSPIRIDSDATVF